MSRYHYLPLSNASENIRLLRLLPAEAEGAKIRGELFEHRLQTSSRSSYEALSYVWGSWNPVQSILIDNGQLDVTPNLYAALVRLRDASFPRIIWIDAICIDQADDEEKSDQIRIMANIYGKANRVLVWLGESADDSDKALEIIRARGAVYMNEPKTGVDDVDDVLELIRAEDAFSANEPKTRKIQQVITSLLQREWFERIWVCQELLRVFD
jgi:hypothetical protein